MNFYFINLDKSQLILCKAIKPPTYLRRYVLSKADYICLMSRNGISIATCAIFRRKVRYVRSMCGVRWSALRVRSICCVSIKYEFLVYKSRQISINIINYVKPSNRPHIYGGMFLARQIMSYEH